MTNPFPPNRAVMTTDPTTGQVTPEQAAVLATQVGVADRAPAVSPTFTGTVTVPTAPTADSTTRAASTAFVKAVAGDLAPKSSPALTGTPTAPTPAVGTDTTQVATAALVKATADTLLPALRAITGNYVLALPDANDAIAVNGTGPLSVSFPSNTTVPFPLATTIRIANVGTSTVNIVDATTGGTTVVRTLVAGETATFLKYATNDWVEVAIPVSIPDGSITGLKLDPALLAQISAGGGTVRPTALARLDAALAARTTKPVRIAITGSSTPAGVGASSPAKSWASLMVAAFQAAYPSGLGTETAVLASNAASFGTLSTSPGVHGYNASEGGTFTSNFLNATERTAVANLGSALIVIQVSSNDFSTNTAPATAKANLLTVINDLKSKVPAGAAMPVFALVHGHERYDSRTHTYPWAQYGAMQREIADADPSNVVALDVSGLFAAAGFPGANDAEATASGLGVSDKIHLSDNGHAFMAKVTTPLLDAAAGAKVGSTGGGGTVQPPAVYKAVTDTVTRADNTTVAGTADSGQSYTPRSGTWGVAGNRLTLTSGTDGLLVVPVGALDQSFGVDLLHGAAGVQGVRLRVAANGDGIPVYFDGANIRLGTVIGNQLTQRATAPSPANFAAGTSGRLVATVVGKVVTAFLNGAQVLTHTLSDADAAAITGTDAALRQTVSGITNGWFDNLSVTRVEPTLLLSDTVQRADSTTSLGVADTGQTWTVVSGVAGVSANRMYGVSGAPVFATVDVGASDVSVSANVLRPTGGTSAISARVSGTNRISVYMDQGSSSFALSVTTAGVTNVRGTAPIPASVTTGSTPEVRLDAVGNVIVGYLNGVELTRYTLSADENTALSGTSVGWRQATSGPTVTNYSNFKATRLTAPAVNPGSGSGGAVGPSGFATTTPPLGDEPGWKQVVRQGFDTPFTAGNFRAAYPQMTTIANIAATGGGGMYRDQIISGTGSEIALDIGWDETAQEFRGAYLLPDAYRSHLYGRVDYRLVMPTIVKGWKMAGLWWSNDNDWQKGEFDFIETGSLGEGVKFYTHVVGSAKDNAYANESVKFPGTTTPVTTAVYHTYSLRWTPTEISIWVDGQKADATTDQRGFPKTPMRYGLQYEFSSLTSAIPPEKTARGKVYIDWITMYDYDASTAP